MGGFTPSGWGLENGWDRINAYTKDAIAVAQKLLWVAGAIKG